MLVCGRIALRVTIRPVSAYAPFVVAEGVNFEPILGTDFLNEHGIGVLAAQHALIFQHQDLLVPFYKNINKAQNAKACSEGFYVSLQKTPRLWYSST